MDHDSIKSLEKRSKELQDELNTEGWSSAKYADLQEVNNQIAAAKNGGKLPENLVLDTGSDIKPEDVDTKPKRK